MPKPHLLLLAGLLAAFGISHFADKIDPYYLDVLTGIGINVILAVSLNLVNGYTGQFSLGHAGFMAVGAYLSAAVTVFLGPKLLGAEGGSVAEQGVLFLSALVIGGLSAAFAGLLVGVPSLRLKGDYLALVTLGFGEIIRVIFQNVEVLGGALGLNGIPPYTTIFWVLSFVAFPPLALDTPAPVGAPVPRPERSALCRRRLEAGRHITREMREAWRGQILDLRALVPAPQSHSLGMSRQRLERGDLRCRHRPSLQ
jgi:ABC-type branched-subunit amino acid transport system permease subunit